MLARSGEGPGPLVRDPVVCHPLGLDQIVITRQRTGPRPPPTPKPPAFVRGRAASGRGQPAAQPQPSVHWVPSVATTIGAASAETSDANCACRSASVSLAKPG